MWSLLIYIYISLLVMECQKVNSRCTFKTLMVKFATFGILMHLLFVKDQYHFIFSSFTVGSTRNGEQLPFKNFLQNRPVPKLNYIFWLYNWKWNNLAKRKRKFQFIYFNISIPLCLEIEQTQSVVKTTKMNKSNGQLFRKNCKCISLSAKCLVKYTVKNLTKIKSSTIVSWYVKQKHICAING